MKLTQKQIQREALGLFDVATRQLGDKNNWGVTGTMDWTPLARHVLRRIERAKKQARKRK